MVSFGKSSKEGALEHASPHFSPGSYARSWKRVSWRTMRRPAALLVAISAIAWPACSSEPEPAEARIRALLAEMEVAAEAKDLRPLKAVVSERYTDELGNDRRGIVRLLTYHFLRNQSIHLLTRVAAIELPEPGRASVTAYVAMAGRPIPDADALTQLRANLYRFDFALEDVGKSWQVTRAAWRPAEARDFL
jgi:hypothetical protein